MTSWSHQRFYAIPEYRPLHPIIGQAVSYLEGCGVEKHPFFDLAVKQPLALKTWAEQEMIVSSNFSQALAEWISTIDNCHVRTLVMPVLAGEHHELTKGKASKAHPALAERLCISMGTVLDSTVALSPTVSFLDAMFGAAEKTIFGAGFLGMGNERMLIPEYSAVSAAFQVAWPAADFASFLDANIKEDHVHHRLMEEAATALINLGEAPAEFLAGACSGIDSRIAYYDQLLELLS